MYLRFCVQHSIRSIIACIGCGVAKRTARRLSIFPITGFLFATSLLITSCSSTSSIRKTGDTRIDAILETAQSLIGTPYCAQGATPDCFDCSGFVAYCFQAANVYVARTSTDLFASGNKVVLEAIHPGDLVFFNTFGKGVSHVGIYIGDNAFIHSSTSHGVMISNMNDMYWKPRYVGSRRIITS